MLYKYHTGKSESFLQSKTFIIHIRNKRNARGMEYYWKYVVSIDAIYGKLYKKYGNFVSGIQQISKSSK